MRAQVLLLLAAGQVPTPGVVVAQVVPVSRPSEVSTSATGQRTVMPDHATIVLQFHVLAQTRAEAGTRLAGRADSIRRSLIRLGIPGDSLVTLSPAAGRLQAVTQALCIARADPRDHCRQVVDTMWRAHEVIQVRIGNLSLVGPVVDSALAHDIGEISPVHFSVTSRRQAYLDALGEAARLAREQAEIMASAAGGAVGEIITLTTDGAHGGGFNARDFSSHSVEGGAQSSPGQARQPTLVTPPPQVVQATVYGRWQLVPRVSPGRVP